MAKARTATARSTAEMGDDDDAIAASQTVSSVDPEDENEAAAVASGYLRDFISGQRIRATPEEVQATQVFSRRLVDDFAYPIDHITTRPQFRVSRRPSEVKKSYPVDIAVFSSSQRLESDCTIIVECKSETEKLGRKQLETYLTLSDAYIGVWFNGKSHLYLHKYYEKGKVFFRELPTLPRFGQRVEDIGLYKRGDLETSASLKAVFRDIRHHLAGNTVGITHDIRLAHQIINILFCKIYDETTKGPEGYCQVNLAEVKRPLPHLCAHAAAVAAAHTWWASPRTRRRIGRDTRWGWRLNVL